VRVPCSIRKPDGPWVTKPGMMPGRPNVPSNLNHSQRPDEPLRKGVTTMSKFRGLSVGVLGKPLGPVGDIFMDFSALHLAPKDLLRGSQLFGALEAIRAQLRRHSACQKIEYICIHFEKLGELLEDFIGRLAARCKVYTVPAWPTKIVTLAGARANIRRDETDERGS